jgi:6-phosphogluconate dehydrogenase
MLDCLVYNDLNKIIYIMGVSGCGKTTIGELLSQQTGLPFFDGDQFHPVGNIKKMTSGIPLTDEDRWPWLNSIRNFAKQQSIDSSIIIACSALKQTYREILSNIQNVSCYFIYLKGPQSLLTQRLETRVGHYMTAQLLSSQLEILEIPKEALVVNIECSPSEMVTKIINELSLTFNMQEFGLIGLGVMGKSLSRNLAQKGIKLSLFNRFVKDKEENVAANFITQYPELNTAKAFEDIFEFVASLELPRKIIIMVNAGNATDDIIEQLTPLLQANDVIIDGGNSLYLDTENRIERLKPMGIHLIGAGISGGEEGALNGPSIMPGGAIEAYSLVQSYLEKIAAKNQNGVSCCQFIGGGGAGHFVKMVHNGIEYAEMQLLAELIQFLKIAGGFSYDLIALLLKPFLQTEKSSYLLEITIQILQKKVNGQLVLELILDNAGNKGTGSWTTIEAAKAGIPIPTLTAALNARFISALWQERQQASQKIATNRLPQPIDIHLVMDAYQLCRIINHQQGFHLIAAVSKEKGWNIDLSNLARVWTAGCIIRSSLMDDLQKILSESSSVFFHPTVIQQINQLKGSLKQTLELGLSNEVPMDCFSASAQYLFAYKQGVSGASIIQAQRDFFGAHTYQLKEDPTGPFYHTNWH